MTQHGRWYAPPNGGYSANEKNPIPHPKGYAPPNPSSITLPGHSKPEGILSPYSEEDHLDELVAVLQSMQSVTPVYPPSAYYSGSEESLRQWLVAEDGLHRVVICEQGKAVGHAMLTKPRPLVSAALKLDELDIPAMELGKFFVLPLFRGSSAASSLLNAVLFITQSAGVALILSVVDTSDAAIRFYQREGMEEGDSFDGSYGRNRSFII